MIALTTVVEDWALKEPFEIAGKVYTSISVVVATLTDESGCVGRGEAAGVDYDGETPASMMEDIESVADQVVITSDPNVLQTLLPKGGARNALDCALRDLLAKRSGIAAWRAAGLRALAPLTTAVTLGMCDEASLRHKAQSVAKFPLLKVKVDADRHVDLIRIVREEHPAARIVIDANGAWTRNQLEKLLPQLVALGVELIEQPVPEGAESTLDGLVTQIPLAADESCRDRRSLPSLKGRFGYVNIKLDKCGGLTEGLAMIYEARRMGMRLMVGNMCGTSLAMAPAFLIGQVCDYVDLDGPLLQCKDRCHPMTCRDGLLQPPQPSLWG